MSVGEPQAKKRGAGIVPDSAQELERRAANLQQMIATMQAEQIDLLVRAAFVRREQRAKPP